MTSATKLVPLLAALGLATGLVAAPVAEASVSLVTSQPSLGANDFIDWTAFGPAFTVVPGPAAVTSSLGVQASVDDDNHVIERRDQTTGGWSGNFAVSDALIFTQGSPGPLVIDFSSSVKAAGAQIQQDLAGAFLATITAYDSANAVLGSFDLQGLSDNLADDSAIFLGISSTAFDIDRIEFSMEAARFPGFAINRLELVSREDVGGSSGVPFPPNLLLLTVALLGLSLTRLPKLR